MQDRDRINGRVRLAEVRSKHPTILRALLAGRQGVLRLPSGTS